MPWRGLLTLIALTLLLAAACGGGDDDDADEAATATPTPAATAEQTATPTATSTPAQTPTATPTEAPPPEFSLASSAFAEGEPIPVRYSCDGLNVSPPLQIEGLPEGTATLALVLDDPDAPGGTFDHWLRYDIPVTAAIAEGAASNLDVGSLGTAGGNDFGNNAYGGPCPLSGTHRYVLTLYALDGELGLAEGATKDQLDAAIDGRIVAQTQLSGTYNRDQARRPPAGGFPATEVTANLTITYKVGDTRRPVTFEQSELPIPPATVQAQWYQADGRYVVVYNGLSLEQTGPLCPGNSLRTAAGFLHVSNAPTGEGACQGVTLLEPPVGVRACGEIVVYVTAIPSDLGGNLFGTVEVYPPDGSIIGLTSVAAVEPDGAPEVDLNTVCGA